MNNNPVAYGGFADVWEGIYQGEQVCIKVLRIGNDTVNGNDQKNSLAVSDVRNLPARPIKG